MKSPSLESFQHQAENLRRYLSSTNMMRGLISRHSSYSEPTILQMDLSDAREASPDTVRWRVMEHTLAVGHLYALYESFCEEILRDWVEFLTSEFAFADLPEKLIESYQDGFAQIAGLLPTPRYPTLNIAGLVENFNSAMKGSEAYRLDPECLIHHRNNLRWPDLCLMLQKCGISNIGEWIGRNDEILNYLPSKGSHTVDQVSSKLSEFIQYRNDCSHGVVQADEILGHLELIELIDFVSALTTAIDQLVSWKKLEHRISKHEAKVSGRVTEVFKRANAFICKSPSANYSLGQRIYVKNGANLYSTLIESLQVEGESVTTAFSTSEIEVGMQVGRTPAKGSDIVIIE